MLEHDNYIIKEVGVNNDFLPLLFERLERINDCIHYYYCLYTVAFINCFLIFEFKIKIAISLRRTFLNNNVITPKDKHILQIKLNLPLCPICSMSRRFSFL